MPDIIERLRDAARGIQPHAVLLQEAADEIERLRALKGTYACRGPHGWEVWEKTEDGMAKVRLLRGMEIDA